MQFVENNLGTLVEAVVGSRRAAAILEAVAVPAALTGPKTTRVSRAQLAMAMNLLLFEGLEQRVPYARAYVRDGVRSGRKVQFDHGALRTVKAPSGALPEGEAAMVRILEPLGYRRAEVYPLDRIALTGRSYAHQDFPEDIPQFFLSEFHPERFSAGFQVAVARTLAGSQDPLPPRAVALLAELQAEGALSFDQAQRLLPDLVACFDRQHPAPLRSDYQTLLAESEEMAWIATEGNAFNHVTDRVADVAALALEQKALGRPMKAAVECSASGRVLQTAFRAAPVERTFRTAAGHLEVVTVPGSFFEFITRKPMPDGRLDLSFDTGNAQAIFKMTSAGGE
ncbi:MAG: DUF1338 family protein [Holophaga sp.]|nr:DUF1338 family protein [Holophaga sp.]